MIIRRRGHHYQDDEDDDDGDDDDKEGDDIELMKPCLPPLGPMGLGVKLDPQCNQTLH